MVPHRRAGLIRSEFGTIWNPMRDIQGRSLLGIVIARPAVADAALSAQDQCLRPGGWLAGWRAGGLAMIGVREAWPLVKESVLSFIADDALSKGAAIAFYMVTSIAPVLVIVIAIAGLAFGHDAAQGAIVGQLSGLMGDQSAKLLQTAIESAAGKTS